MDFAERKRIMIEYLKLKLEEGDFHGVQDAASDIRDIESEEFGYKLAQAEEEVSASQAPGHLQKINETIFQVDDKGVLHPLGEVGRKVNATLPGGATETYYYGEYPGGDILKPSAPPTNHRDRSPSDKPAP